MEIPKVTLTDHSTDGQKVMQMVLMMANSLVHLKENMMAIQKVGMSEMNWV